MWITCDGIERGRVMCGPHDEVEQGNLLPVLPGHGSSSSTEEGLLPSTGGTWWIPARRKGVRVMALMKPLPSMCSLFPYSCVVLSCTPRATSISIHSCANLQLSDDASAAEEANPSGKTGGKRSVEAAGLCSQWTGSHAHY